MGLEDYSTELKPAVEAFLTNLRRRGKAPRTLKRWSVELDRFVAWVGERKLYEIDAGALELGFLSEWERAFKDRNGRAPALNSTRAVIQAVRSFYAFLDRFGLLVDANGGVLRNPALALELPVIPVKPELDWLRAEEDEALLSCPMSAREDVIVFLLRMTGLRLGEALSLTNRDVNVGEGSVTVTTSKTVAGLRSVPINPELRPHLDRWIAFVRREGFYRPDGPFLVTRHGTPMKAQYVGRVVARVGEQAGIARRVTPHTLRRTFGSDLVNRGVRLEVVSRLLGHASTSITEKAYARLEDATVRREMLAALTA
ncbi:tyrosine-type recombinase/integrase [Gaiella sp.]|uniref:tyrosine-type recombinase/integrase n=1 Tax=Gaiella sp. TaxID=2663207 RepID=UPI002E342707|nr:tyrosine-type recombinase/integrase [Gaiella sp.]HEX5582351.1 tyrosine-type recombinase/integrase [Gaiella sp.]